MAQRLLIPQVLSCMLVCSEWMFAFCCDQVWLDLLLFTFGLRTQEQLFPRLTFVALHRSQWWQRLAAATESLWTKKKSKSRQAGWSHESSYADVLSLPIDVTAAALDPAGGNVGTGGPLGSVQIWALQSGSLMGKLGLKSAVLQLGLWGEWVAAATADGKLHTLQLIGNKLTKLHSIHSDSPCIGLSLLPGSEAAALVYAKADGSLLLLSSDTCTKIGKSNASGQVLLAMQVTDTVAVTVSADATGGEALVLEQWSIPSLQLLHSTALSRTEPAAHSKTCSIQISGDKLVVSGLRPGVLSIRSLMTPDSWHHMEAEASGTIELVGGDEHMAVYEHRRDVDGQPHVGFRVVNIRAGASCTAYDCFGASVCGLKPLVVARDGVMLVAPVQEDVGAVLMRRATRKPSGHTTVRTMQADVPQLDAAPSAAEEASVSYDSDEDDNQRYKKGKKGNRKARQNAVREKKVKSKVK